MFEPIGTGTSRKKTALQRNAQFLRTVRQVVRTVYPRMTALRVVRAYRNPRTKVLTLSLEHEHHITRLTHEHGIIRAAMRREGIDVRSVVIERA